MKANHRSNQPVSRPVLLAFSAVALLALAGCSGGNTSSQAVDELIEKSKEYTQLQEDISSLETEQKQIGAQLPLLQKKFEANQNKLDNLNGELAALGSGAQDSYAEYLESVKDVPPDIVIIMSERFLRDYPLDSNRDAVKAKLVTANSAQAANAEQQKLDEVKRQEQEAARQQARLQKFKSGRMSTMELKSYLGGKSEAEIIELMGQPNTKSSTSVWNYRNYYGVSNTGKRGSVRIFFSGGRVNSVGLF